MESRRVRLYIITFVADLVLLTGIFKLAGQIQIGTSNAGSEAGLMQAMVPIFAVIAIYNRVYSIRGLMEFRYSATRLLFALLVSAFLFVFLLFYLKPDIGPLRGEYSLALVAIFLSMLGLRGVIAFYVAKALGGRVQNRLIIDDGGPEIVLEKAFRIEVDPDFAIQAPSDPERLNALGHTMRGMDRVIVSCPNDRLAAWADILRAAGVEGEIPSETFNELGVLDLIRENEMAFLVVSSGPLGLRSRLIKRSMDLLVGVMTLAILAPVIIIVALAIELEDGGPIFFVQPRIGHGNRLFKMLKFRSIKVEASDLDGSRSIEPNDARVTRVGKIIRATSIDELPQLFNVLLGEMSLVGPRPHALGSRASNKLFWEIDGEYWQRHALTPGMTGLAQIRGYRGATETEEHLTNRLQLDLEYIRDWSPWLDLKILVATLRLLVPEKP